MIFGNQLFLRDLFLLYPSFPFFLPFRFPSSCSVRGIEMALDGHEDKFFPANKLHYVSTRDCASTASRDLHGLRNKIWRFRDVPRISTGEYRPTRGEVNRWISCLPKICCSKSNEMACDR